jgi:hypothetical protein
VRLRVTAAEKLADKTDYSKILIDHDGRGKRRKKTNFLQKNEGTEIVLF